MVMAVGISRFRGATTDLVPVKIDTTQALAGLSERKCPEKLVDAMDSPIKSHQLLLFRRPSEGWDPAQSFDRLLDR